MDLDALGNIGEFIGSIGVVISLIYLAIQVRENTRSNYAESFDRISTDLQQFTLQIFRDEKTNRLYRNYILSKVAVEDISEEDLGDVRIILVAAFMDLWRAYEKYHRGQVEESTWEVVLTLFRRVYFDAPVVQFWFAGAQIFPDEFVRYVKKEMEDT